MPKRRRTFKRRGVSKYLKSVIGKIARKNLETKYYTVAYDADSVRDNGRTVIDSHLNAFAQGTDQDDRVGNSCRVTGLHGSLIYTGADTTNTIRCILYIPKDKDFSLSNSPALKFNALPDTNKFTILKDWIVCLSAAGNFCKRITVSYKFKGRGLNTTFAGPASTDGEVNKVYLYMVSDSLAVADPEVNGWVRTYFKDG